MYPNYQCLLIKHDERVDMNTGWNAEGVNRSPVKVKYLVSVSNRCYCFGEQAARPAPSLAVVDG